MTTTADDFSLRRLALATAYWLRPQRRRCFAPFVARILRDRIITPPVLPDSSRISDCPPGFAGLVRDTSTPIILEAMARGFYPQSHWGTMKWWSPPQRAIMPLDTVHIAKRFRRTMRQTDMTLAFDTDFSGVIERCAAPRHPSKLNLTWLIPSAISLYKRLHVEGHAHSVEIRDGQGVLVGGLFGVTTGPVFSALSMFHTQDNASKIAIVGLYHHLADAGFTLVDHQIMSPWVEALGGVTVKRSLYEVLLRTPPKNSVAPGRWNAKFTLAETAAWEPAPLDRDRSNLSNWPSRG